MYVTVTGSGKARVIQFVEQHRIPKTNKKKTVVIETIGNYEKMLAEDPNIIEKLKVEAKRRTEEKKLAKQPITLEVKKEAIEENHQSHTNFHLGHSAIRRVWQDLELDTFFNQTLDCRYPKKVQEAIFSLVMHRMMNPSSIRASHLRLPRYAGIQSHHRDLYYQLLDILDELTESLINHLCQQFQSKTHRQGPVAYYDVTTFSFESVTAGELRIFGYSKDHKHNEVQVVMGLLMDNQGIPISYQLFPGNTMDQSTLEEAVKDLKKRYQMDKIVVVADRGLNSKDNLAMLLENGHDFVMSYSLKKAPENIRQIALESGEWEITRVNDQGEVIYQSKVVDHRLEVKVELSEEEKQQQPKKAGRPRKYKTIEIPVQIHVTWEANRARKDWKDRQKAVEKAQASLDKPGQFKASLKRGRNQYITFDINTEDASLDEARIEQQECYDGYYAVMTNQQGLETLEVTQMYGGLWEIEETFRVLKSDLRARPVYVWTDEHVRGHFALCFLSLCLMRYIQYRVRKFSNKSLSCEVIGQSLYDASAMVFGEWPLIHLVPNNISEEFLLIQKAMDMPPLLTVMTRSELKRITQLDIADNYLAE